MKNLKVQPQKRFISRIQQGSIASATTEQSMHPIQLNGLNLVKDALEFIKNKTTVTPNTTKIPTQFKIKRQKFEKKQFLQTLDMSNRLKSTQLDGMMQNQTFSNFKSRTPNLLPSIQQIKPQQKYKIKRDDTNKEDSNMTNTFFAKNTALQVQESVDQTKDESVSEVGQNSLDISQSRRGIKTIDYSCLKRKVSPIEFLRIESVHKFSNPQQIQYNKFSNCHQESNSVDINEQSQMDEISKTIVHGSIMSQPQSRSHTYLAKSPTKISSMLESIPPVPLRISSIEQDMDKDFKDKLILRLRKPVMQNRKNMKLIIKQERSQTNMPRSDQSQSGSKQQLENEEASIDKNFYISSLKMNRRYHYLKEILRENRSSEVNNIEDTFGSETVHPYLKPVLHRKKNTTTGATFINNINSNNSNINNNQGLRSFNGDDQFGKQLTFNEGLSAINKGTVLQTFISIPTVKRKGSLSSSSSNECDQNRSQMLIM